MKRLMLLFLLVCALLVVNYWPTKVAAWQACPEVYNCGGFECNGGCMFCTSIGGSCHGGTCTCEYSCECLP